MSDSIQNIIELLQSLPAEGSIDLDTPAIKALNGEDLGGAVTDTGVSVLNAENVADF